MTKNSMYESPEIFVEELPAESGFLGSGDTSSQMNDLQEVETDWN